jgi:hypothetical protein
MKTLNSNVIRVPFVAVICLAMLVCQFGCTVQRTVTEADIENDPTEAIQPGDEISEVVLKTGEVIAFDKDGGHCLYSFDKKVIRGTSNQSKHIDIAIEDIEQVTMKRVSTGRTVYVVLVWTAFAASPVVLYLIFYPDETD